MIKHIFKIVWRRKKGNLLLIMEIFLTFCFLVFITVTGLQTWKVFHLPLGFSWDNVLILHFNSLNFYGDDQWTRGVFDTQTKMVEAVRSFDAVEEAGLSFHIPYYDYSTERSVTYKGRTAEVDICSIADGTLEVLKVDLVKGRYFGAEDDALERMPVIINERLRKELFHDEDPRGKTITMALTGHERIVVGVMSDFRKHGEFRETQNAMLQRYNYSYAEHNDDVSGWWPHRQLMIRLRPGTTTQQEEIIVKRIQDIARPWSLEVTTMEERRSKWLKDDKVSHIALAIIGILVMMMVCLGLMGVLWQNVTRRTKEIGLRRAKGATIGRIIQQIIGEMIMMTTIGVILGVLLVVQFPLLDLSGSVEETSIFLGIIISIVVMYGLTMICSLYPSYMAVRIKPAEALHYE